MFVGNINDVAGGLAKYPERIRQALRFLQATDFSKLPDGKIEIDDGMYANLQRYETRIPESGKPEAHRQYVDVQYVVEGEEELGWCPLHPRLQVYTPYDAEKDLIFYQDLEPTGSTVPLHKGDFAVLYPQDVHRPCGSLNLEPSHVTKVVVKVRVDTIKETVKP